MHIIMANFVEEKTITGEGKCGRKSARNIPGDVLSLV